MTRRVLVLCAAATVVASMLGAADAQTERWYAGDFHVHTTYSHDSWDPMTEDHDGEPWVLGHSVANQFAIAASRGLDFLAITDHNVLDAQTDPGFNSNGVLGLHAYENSLSGHAQMLGAGACYAPEGTFVPAPGDECNDWPDKSAARVTLMADALRAGGGLFQINHPAGNSVDFPHDADWGYGYDVVPDTVEVWNIQSVWQPPAPSSNSIDDAIRFWEGFLNAGYHVAATGGSDNHWVSTTAAQGVGQPTTYVYASDRTEAAILEGVRRGRTFISWQPPALQGPRLHLTADADGDGSIYESMVGDTVPAGSRVRVDVEGIRADSSALTGGVDCLIELITNEGRRSQSCGSHDGVSMSVPEGTRWARAELLMPLVEEAIPAIQASPVGHSCGDAVGDQTTYCRNRLVRVAMTSPIYFS